MKCPYCGAEVILKSMSYIYKNRNDIKGNVWVCSRYPECDSYVGCHKGTDLPLGRPANLKLRNLKKEAHRQFDPIWKSGLMTRKAAYKWLADRLNIPYEECHIGWFDIEMCNKVIHLCKYQDNPVINEYRKKHYGVEKYEMFTRGYKYTRK